MDIMTEGKKLKGMFTEEAKKRKGVKDQTRSRQTVLQCFVFHVLKMHHIVHLYETPKA